MIRRRFFSTGLTALLLLAATSHTFAESAGKKPESLTVVVRLEKVQVEADGSHVTKTITESKLTPINGGHIRTNYRADQTDVPLWRFLGQSQNETIKQKRPGDQLQFESQVYSGNNGTVAFSGLSLAFTDVQLRGDGGTNTANVAVRGARLIPLGTEFALFGATESTDARVVNAVGDGKTPTISGVAYTAYFLSVTVNRDNRSAPLASR